MMHTETSPFELEHVGDVALVRVRSREIRHPQQAVDFGAGLDAAIQKGGASKVLIDFTGNDYLCSTAFATLLKLGRDVQQRGGILKICCLDANVLIGANIIGLGRLVPIFDDTRTALDSFSS